jgi:hypothetical protein
VVQYLIILALPLASGSCESEKGLLLYYEIVKILVIKYSLKKWKSTLIVQSHQ